MKAARAIAVTLTCIVLAMPLWLLWLIGGAIRALAELGLSALGRWHEGGEG